MQTSKAQIKVHFLHLYIQRQKNTNKVQDIRIKVLALKRTSIKLGTQQKCALNLQLIFANRALNMALFHALELMFFTKFVQNSK